MTRSTLERHLRLNGFSGKTLKREAGSNPNHGRRFQHEHRNSLWQADFKAGPHIANPLHQNKKERTWLLVILDNATRKVVHAKFYFN